MNAEPVRGAIRRIERATRIALGICLVGVVAVAPSRAATSGRALPRYPTLHGDTVVFEAGGNLWRVSREGGVAQRLTTDRGMDLMPRFSPDGSRIAFTGQYEGNTDVYVMPAAGGAPTRLTFHSDVVKEAPLRWGPDNMVVSWTPDGREIVFLSRRDTFNSWFGRLFAVPAEGGLPRALPLPSGGTLSYAPDGKRIAYNRIFRNFRTWKQYYGGLAQDVWTYDLESRHIERVTDWKGTDTYPMWYGDVIYFASDRGPDKRLNLWAYDIVGGTSRQITHFTEYDVDWPNLGDTGIVLQCGGSLWVLDLPSEELHELDVAVPGDGLPTRPRWVDASETIDSYDIAPNGKRALFGARGEVFTVPEQHGNVRDLTRTSGARETDPVWSPDGKRVAYITDRSGEAQVAVRSADGSGDETVVTDRSHGYLYQPVWSPDSKKLAFSDSDQVLWYVDIESGKPVRVDQDLRREIRQYSWSPDALWLAYSKAADNDLQQVYLYDVKGEKIVRLSRGETSDSDPVFDPGGKYLYFVSRRHANPVFSESEFNVATVKTAGVYAAILQAGQPSPFAPRSDEGLPEAEAAKPAAWKPGATAPIRIDPEGLAGRVVALPVPAGDIGALSAAAGRLYYMTVPLKSFETALAGEEPALHVFDLDNRKDAVVVSPLDGYALSADGTRVLYKSKDHYTIVPAQPQKGADDPDSGSAGDEQGHELDLSDMQAFIDPVAEWDEMFHQAWRLERDLFYNPEMNGIDWPAMLERYEPLLRQVGWREDLNYIIGEMLGELHNSHTYVGGGDVSREEPVPTGLLGVDFGLDESSGRYFFRKIYPGDNSREALRSPLTEPGIQVHEGDFLLAVNGRDLAAPTNPYSLFVNTLDRTVSLVVAETPQGRNRREVTVKPITEELELRLAAWIAHNREEVDKASGGKLGYLYLSDMDDTGMEQFIRQFFPQIRKQGLVVDVRWNGGGFIDQIVLERLRRVLVGMATSRERVPFPIPPEVLHGPMACLMNHYSASDGDIFPYYFRKYGLGPLIGERTWGGVRGIRGYWKLVDGGYVTIPEDSLYGLDSRWILENHGVDPDIEVDDLPGDVVAGRDAQLEAGIRYLLDRLREHPEGLPEPPPWLPAYPPEGP